MSPKMGYFTLRALRVILRETTFEAKLTFVQPSEVQDLALLTACILALRRAGTGRNRGRGRLRAKLCRDTAGRPETDITPTYYQTFAQEVRHVSP